MKTHGRHWCGWNTAGERVGGSDFLRLRGLQVDAEWFGRTDRLGMSPIVKDYLRKFEHFAVCELVGRGVHISLRCLMKPIHVHVGFFAKENAFELPDCYLSLCLFVRVLVARLLAVADSRDHLRYPCAAFVKVRHG